MGPRVTDQGGIGEGINLMMTSIIILIIRCNITNRYLTEDGEDAQAEVVAEVTFSSFPHPLPFN